MNRCSFFKRFAAVVACVALAPEIAFNVRLPLKPKLDIQEMFTVCYDLARKRKTVETIDILANMSQMEELKRDYPEAFGKFQLSEPFRQIKVVGIYEQLRSTS